MKVISILISVILIMSIHSLCQEQSEKFDKATLAYNTGDFKKSITLFNELLFLKDETNMFDFPNIISLKINLGNCYNQTGQIDCALLFYSEAKDLILENYPSLTEWISALYKNIAVLYKRSNNFKKAEYYYYRSIENCDKNNLENLSDIYHNIGNLHYQFINNHEALNNYFISYNMMKKVANKEFVSLNKDIGIVYMALNDTVNAKKFLDLAMNEYYKAANNDKMLLASIQYNYGTFYELVNEELKSETYLLKAILNYNEIYNKRHPNIAECYIKLGDLYKKQHEPQKALDAYQNALISNSFDFEKSNITSNPTFEDAISKNLYLAILEKKAEVLYEMGNLEYAEDIVRIALKASEKIIDQYYYEENKTTVVDNHRQICLLGADIYYALYIQDYKLEYIEEFTKYIEYSRNHLIKEKNRINDFIVRHFPDSVQDNESRLRRNIGSLRYQIYNTSIGINPDSMRIRSMRTKLFSLEEQHEKLINDQKTKNNKWKGYTSLNQTTDLSDTKSKLQIDQCVIQYLLKPEALYCVFISKDTTIIQLTKTDSVFFNNLDFLLNHINKFNYLVDETEYNRFINSSYYIYKFLIYPFKNEITGKQLIIVPDDKLNYLSFDVLLSDTLALGSMNYKILPYLLTTNSITYLPALSLLRTPENSFKNHLLKMAVFAPVEFLDRKELKNSESEANELAMNMEFVPYTYYNDSESNFKRSMNDFDIIHLATHSNINDKDYLFSKLIFSGDSLNDGDFNMYEMLDINISNKMVILNSCETAVGKEIYGEGMMNFSRLFIFNGTGNLIASLWKINDHASFKVILRFYNYLFDGTRSDIALQKAKLDYITNAEPGKDHPYYWAGHSLFSSNNLTITKSRWYYYFGGILLITAILLVTLFRRKRF
ncbi:MAG: CHAT domain-containing tetratricopeptide repeat protein [Bacteroidota bacterium]